METTRINKDLSVRIVPVEGGYYEGYILIELQEEKEGSNSILLNTHLEPGWRKLTNQCYTKQGCKSAIKNWIKDHTIVELKLKIKITFK